MHSSTTTKSCEKNTVATLNDIGNVRHDVKGERMYSESLRKPGKQNTVINHEKLVKEESVKDIDSKISGKQNTVKGIELNKKNHRLEAQDYSKCYFCMLLIFALSKTEFVEK